MEKKRRTKTGRVSFRVHPEYEDKLARRSAKEKDDSTSQTARNILYRDLDKDK